jgi:fibronectin type 3 domain-containing protein
MRKPLHSSPATRSFILLSLAALSLLAGCGKVRSVFARREPDNPHSVTLSWDASKTPVAGYNVYREFQYGGPVKLTSAAVAGTEFKDTTVAAGRTYSYYVTSVDLKGVESKPSEKIWVTVPTTVTPASKQ